jgi:hypothetical protein
MSLTRAPDPLLISAAERIVRIRVLIAVAMPITVSGYVPVTADPGKEGRAP